MQADLASLVELFDGLSSSRSSRQPRSDEIVELLRLLRKSKLRRPDLVTRIGLKATENRSLSTTELLSIYEQVAIAALDKSDEAMAITCLLALKKRFPASGRVKRLEGMLHEANGRYQQALEIYDEQLKANPANIFALKRKVCVYRAQGATKNMIDALHRLTELAAGDPTVWVELSEVHIAEQNYEAASFCLEELVLLIPRCSQIHCRLAEIYYSKGTSIDLLSARRHYSLSLNLQTMSSGNSRAAYGLAMTCKRLLDLPDSDIAGDPEQSKAVSKELLKLAIEQIGGAAGSGIVSLTAAALTV